MAGQFLQFVSVKRALCKICRNYTNQAFPGQKAVDISAGLKQSPDKQADYDKEIIKFQQTMEAKARNGYMRVTGCREDWNPPSVVNVSTAGIDSGDMMKGIFWPQEIYKAHTGEALPKKQLTRHIHRGKTYWGIIRETEYGNPIGTIKLKDIDQRKIEHVSQAANTENGSTSAQVRWIAGLLNTPSGGCRKLPSFWLTPKFLINLNTPAVGGKLTCNVSDEFLGLALFVLGLGVFF